MWQQRASIRWQGGLADDGAELVERHLAIAVVVREGYHVANLLLREAHLELVDDPRQVIHTNDAALALVHQPPSSSQSVLGGLSHGQQRRQGVHESGEVSGRALAAASTHCDHERLLLDPFYLEALQLVDDVVQIQLSAAVDVQEIEVCLHLQDVRLVDPGPPEVLRLELRGVLDMRERRNPPPRARHCRNFSLRAAS
eukprot:CAMPEP_0176079532 /NCGR_PEP_ID=MMETSP0120_2-20121206/39779_1 /TAXON_ID=160619 /ORGANISM="Kryptoperidinium foliaceum, Strain CCMP 1326" /LENGTH=197 /DNA_ID=CAMNT_0017413291 /DNA_START=30 /DNA_END=623 /DNA_ORIENTATION=+